MEKSQIESPMGAISNEEEISQVNKKTSLLDKRYPTNTNMQKFKKTWELTGTYQKEHFKNLPRKTPGLVWFVGLFGISTFVGYLTPNPFLCK